MQMAIDRLDDFWLLPPPLSSDYKSNRSVDMDADAAAADNQLWDLYPVRIDGGAGANRNVVRGEVEYALRRDSGLRWEQRQEYRMGQVKIEGAQIRVGNDSDVMYVFMSPFAGLRVF